MKVPDALTQVSHSGSKETWNHRLEFSYHAWLAPCLTDSNYWNDLAGVIVSRCVWAAPWITPLVPNIASSLLCSFQSMKYVQASKNNPIKQASFSFPFLQTCPTHKIEMKESSGKPRSQCEAIRANMQSSHLMGPQSSRTNYNTVFR